MRACATLQVGAAAAHCPICPPLRALALLPPYSPPPNNYTPCSHHLQVPVHCIGMQAYLTPDIVTMELINFRLEALGKLGVELYITEFLFPGEQTGRIWQVDVQALFHNPASVRATADQPSLRQHPVCSR